MSDFILIDGDTVFFNSEFGDAIVTVSGGTLVASGVDVKILENSICIAGDEDDVSVSGCSYITDVYTTSGSGTVTIKSLDSSQLTTKVKYGEDSILLKGGEFEARFTVVTAATNSVPDSDMTSYYLGTGYFVTSNDKVKGT